MEPEKYAALLHYCRPVKSGKFYPENYTKNDKRKLRYLATRFEIKTINNGDGEPEEVLMHVNKTGHLRQVIYGEHKYAIMAAMHTTTSGSAGGAATHCGKNATITKISDHFYWKGMCSDVQNMIAGCGECRPKYFSIGQSTSQVPSSSQLLAAEAAPAVGPADLTVTPGASVGPGPASNYTVATTYGADVKESESATASEQRKVTNANDGTSLQDVKSEAMVVLPTCNGNETVNSAHSSLHDNIASDFNAGATDGNSTTNSGINVQSVIGNNIKQVVSNGGVKRHHPSESSTAEDPAKRIKSNVNSLPILVGHTVPECFSEGTTANTNGHKCITESAVRRIVREALLPIHAKLDKLLRRQTDFDNFDTGFDAVANVNHRTDQSTASHIDPSHPSSGPSDMVAAKANNTYCNNHPRIQSSASASSSLTSILPVAADPTASMASCPDSAVMYCDAFGGSDIADDFDTTADDKESEALIALPATTSTASNANLYEYHNDNPGHFEYNPDPTISTLIYRYPKTTLISLSATAGPVEDEDTYGDDTSCPDALEGGVDNPSEVPAQLSPVCVWTSEASVVDVSNTHVTAMTPPGNIPAFSSLVPTTAINYQRHGNAMYSEAYDVGNH